MRLTGFLLLLLGALQLSSYGQEISTVYKQYTVEDGLQSNSINYIMQDSKGYIWFVGDGSALKYNGRNFKEVHFGGFANRLWEDSQGRFWLCAMGAVAQLDENGVGIPREHADKIFSSLKRTFVHEIAEDSEGNIWYSADNKSTLASPGKRLSEPRYEQVFKIGADSVEMVDLSKEESAFRIAANGFVYQLPGGQFIYTGRSFKSVLNIEKQILRNIPFSDRLIDYPISKFIQLHDGTYLATTVHEIMHFDRDSIYYYAKNPFDSNITCLNQDNNNNLWFGTLNGLWKAPEADFSKLEKMDKLPQYHITSIIEDSESNIWYSTVGGGVIKFSSNDLEKLYWPSFNRKNQIEEIAVGDDYLWFCSNDGSLSILDKDYELENIEVPTVNSAFSLLSLEDRVLTGNQYFFSDKNLGLMEIVKGRYFAREYYNIMVRDSKGNIWVSTQRGLFKFNIKDKKVTTEVSKDELKQSIYALSLDSQDRLWIVGSEGPHIFEDGKIKPAKELLPDFSEVPGLRYFEDINIGFNDHIYLTYAGGIVIVMGEDIQVLKKGEDLTASKNFFCSYLEDEKSIWISGFGGVDKFGFNPKTQKYKRLASLGKKQGLPVLSDGRIVKFNNKVFLGTSEGLYMIDPGNLQHNKLPHIPVHINSIQSRDSVFETKGGIELNHLQNNPIINLDAISFQKEEKILFNYRLIGQSDDWQQTENLNISYTNLKAGNYTFEVYASRANADLSPENTQVQKLSFSIIPHFTQTLIFRTLMGILLALLVGFVVFSAMRWKDRQDRRQRIITELKYQALQSQMSPHFIFNAMNSISFLVKNKKSKEADKYLNKFAGLLRGVLENAQYSFITLLEEMELVQNYLELEQLQFGDQLKIYIDMDPELMAYDLQVPPMLIQPILENAIRHGISPRGFGNLNVNFKNQGDFLKVIIEDDGVGRKYAEELKKQSITHKSRTQVGIKNIYERISVLNNLYGLNMKMEIKDLQNQGKAAGTCVNFMFPKIKYLPEIDNSLFRSFQGLSNTQKEES
ncbi:MAG: histidine kinase [Bacteroidia bacterium]|nr:histidine kinase [Bacteroidia bacterium]